MAQTKISRSIENKLKKIVKPIKKQQKRKRIDLIKIPTKKKKPSKIIIFDTNFLLIPGEFKIDIFKESKDLVNSKDSSMMIFDKTIYELQKLASKKTKHAINAKVGLQLINAKSLEIITSKDNRYADTQILNHEQYFPDKEVIVATQDKELKQKLQKQRTKVIFMKSKKKLGIK